MLFKSRSMDKSYIQEQYLENISEKKRKLSGSKRKEHQGASKEGKKKWKGWTYKRTEVTAHQCKDPNNHYNNCKIDGCTEAKCCKLHLKLNLKIKKERYKEEESHGHWFK